MGMIYFDDLNVGDSSTWAEYTVNYEEMLAYGRTNDPWPFHAGSRGSQQIAVWRIDRQWRLHNHSDVPDEP